MTGRNSRDVAKALAWNPTDPLPGSSSTEPPVGGALYTHPARVGAWRVETAGPKWVKFRSTVLKVGGGRFLVFKESREDWPNGWERV